MLWLSGREDGHRSGRHTARDGALIPYREWRHPEPRAVIISLHGQGGHSGPFTAMGDLLFGMGFSVYAHDHRGFGLSHERRGDIPTYDYFVDDTLEMLHLARERNQSRPAYLLGLSMGGHIALRAAYRAGSQVAGVIALSPGFKLKSPPPWSVLLRGALTALILPSRYLPPIQGDVMTTRNRTHVERARQDERWVDRYTARFHFETVRSIYRARREMARLHVPVLMLQAGDDRLVCPQESRRFFDRIAAEDKEFELLDGLCHNLVAEPEMPEITARIGAWVEERLKPVRLVGAARES